MAKFDDTREGLLFILTAQVDSSSHALKPFPLARFLDTSWTRVAFVEGVSSISPTAHPLQWQHVASGSQSIRVSTVSVDALVLRNDPLPCLWILEGSC